jgi:arginyl-tRNA synthetase
MIEERLSALVQEALASASDELGLEGEPPPVEISTPKQKSHGDFSTNVALVVASRVGRQPRDVADVVSRHLSAAADPLVRSVTVAGPGFINFEVANDWLYESLRQAVLLGDAFGRAEPTGRSVQVEFVSANPTGPLHIGHARNAALGDAVANLMDAGGWSVQREFYFNDAGGQMDRFGASVEARYLQALGRDAEVPEDGYHGDYITDLAREVVDRFGDTLAGLPPAERLARIRDAASERVLDWIRTTLERFRVRFDSYVSEGDLAARGEIDLAIDRLRSAGYVYEADGAVWFRSTAFGDDKDRPLVRGTGAHTYFAADCAYLIDKFRRGFDHLVYVLGADHHGDVARLKGAAEALGYDPVRVEILIYQFVSFLRGGEPMPMSKRAGTFLSLDELIDEVGADAARFTLLSYSNDSPMNFDIDVVKRQSMENPVYYVQYGHARIASILRNASDRGEPGRLEDADLSLLSSEPEIDLLRRIAELPRQMAEAAQLRAPHRLTHFAQELAAQFHRFYTERRVLTDDEALMRARLWLCVGTKQAIANVLRLLGVSAPESMERADG